jgi:hypothetical protein
VVYRLTDPRIGVLIGALRGIFAELVPASALVVAGNDRVAITQAVIAARLVEREWM